MDISRLPVTHLLQSSPASIKTNRQPASVEVVEPVEKIIPRHRTRESFERVVQGELLQKERTSYQSTRGFINERNVGQARPAVGQRDTGSQSRAAISQYLNNTRPEAISDLTQGKSVNFFV
jgi:hypothetical protein